MDEQQAIGASGGSLDSWIKERQTMEMIKEEIDGDLIVRRDPNRITSLGGPPGSRGMLSVASNVNRGTKGQKRARKAKRRAQRASRKRNR